jgi:hypothetical protein
VLGKRSIVLTQNSAVPSLSVLLDRTPVRTDRLTTVLGDIERDLGDRNARRCSQGGCHDRGIRRADAIVESTACEALVVAQL